MNHASQQSELTWRASDSRESADNVGRIVPSSFRVPYRDDCLLELVRGHIWGRLTGEFPLKAIGTYPSYDLSFRYSLCLDGDLEQRFRADVVSQLAKMGCSLSGEGSPQLTNKIDFIDYWRRYPQIGDQTVFTAVLKSSEDPHQLSADRLKQALPDHLGHGVSPNLPAAALELSMREEGESDRRSAREYWNAITAFWEHPTAANLLPLVRQHVGCSGWTICLYQVEFQQRGPLVLELLEWGRFAHHLRAIEPRWNEWMGTPQQLQLSLATLSGVLRAVAEYGVHLKINGTDPIYDPQELLDWREVVIRTAEQLPRQPDERVEVTQVADRLI